MVSIDNILRVRKSGRLLSQEAGELMRMNIPKNGSTIPTITAFFILLVMSLFFASESAALDNPHIPNNTVNCSTCHITNPPAGWWTDQGQAGGLCGQCHNAAAAMGTDVTTHVSTKYGNVILQCTDCHNPHYQRQFRLFKDPSYLYKGRISAVTSTTMTQDLTYTGAASWTDNQWAGMLLVGHNDRYRRNRQRCDQFDHTARRHFCHCLRKARQGIGLGKGGAVLPEDRHELLCRRRCDHRRHLPGLSYPDRRIQQQRDARRPHQPAPEKCHRHGL